MNESTNHDEVSDQCSLCNTAIKKPGKIYGSRTCKRCPIRFSRRREGAFLLDYVLFLIATFFISMVVLPAEVTSTQVAILTAVL